VSYRSYEPLRAAIEKKLTSSVRDMSRIITKHRARDEEQAKKYSDLMKNLIECGYTEHSAEVVLTYAANNLWKD
jgi:serine protein kinase